MSDAARREKAMEQYLREQDERARRVEVTPTPPAAAPAPPQGVSDLTIGLGYAAAILLPLVGFIVGFIVIAKGKPGAGFGMVALSVVMMAVALNAAANGRL